MDVTDDDDDYKEIQTFLEIEDEEMKEIAISTSLRNDGKKEKIWVGKGNAAKGVKNKYDTYDESNAFIKVTQIRVVCV